MAIDNARGAQGVYLPSISRAIKTIVLVQKRKPKPAVPIIQLRARFKQRRMSLGSATEESFRTVRDGVWL
jgi:hypothetical protein